MTENNSNTEINKYLFVNLITMLSMSVMQQLGKLVNPADGKAEINFDAAQATIDTLDMLAVKTKGNLDADEAKLMKDTLAMLKLNFVETRGAEEQKKAQSDKGASDSAKATPDEKAHGGGEKPEQKSDPKRDNDPKFHKSYS